MTPWIQYRIMERSWVLRATNVGFASLLYHCIPGWAWPAPVSFQGIFSVLSTQYNIKWTHWFLGLWSFNDELFYLFIFIYLLKKFLKMCIYFWRRGKQGVSRRGAERKGDTKSEAGPRLRAVSTEPNASLKLTSCEIITWVKVGRLTDWTTQVDRKSVV